MTDAIDEPPALSAGGPAREGSLLRALWQRAVFSNAKNLGFLRRHLEEFAVAREILHAKPAGNAGQFLHR